jgi:26S proteasome regulatory subunit N1
VSHSGDRFLGYSMFDTGLWVLSMSITPTHISICLVQAATVSLGIIGAGTNNARIAGMLRNLSSYYYKDPSLLFCVLLLSFVFLLFLFLIFKWFSCLHTQFFCPLSKLFYSLQVRIAQGLVHMGKGLLTLNPYHSDRFMLSKYVQTTPYCV